MTLIIQQQRRRSRSGSGSGSRTLNSSKSTSHSRRREQRRTAHLSTKGNKLSAIKHPRPPPPKTLNQEFTPPPTMEPSGKRSRDTHRPWPSQDSRIYRVSRGSGGKDRHSKVYTAKGLRDRRIRLAVPTAVQFYDLQDRLGLEQPSKAVDWLMDAAANAIADLPSLDSLFPHQLSKSKSCSSNSETSKGSVMSLPGPNKDPLINKQTTFTEFLTESYPTDMDVSRMVPRSTAADYFRGAAAASEHNFSFLQEDYNFSSFPVTGLNGGTLQSNAATPVPRCHHLQRHGATVDRMGMPFLCAPGDNGAEFRVPDGMQMLYGDGFRQWEMKGREQS